jgi:hypothetical protein
MTRGCSRWGGRRAAGSLDPIRALVRAERVAPRRGHATRVGAAPGVVQTGLGSYSTVSASFSVPHIVQTSRKLSTFLAASYREVLSCRWSHMTMRGQAAAAMSVAGYGPQAQMSSSSCRARRGVQRSASMSSSARTATSASAHRTSPSSRSRANSSASAASRTRSCSTGNSAGASSPRSVRSRGGTPRFACLSCREHRWREPTFNRLSLGLSGPRDQTRLRRASGPRRRVLPLAINGGLWAIAQRS